MPERFRFDGVQGGDESTNKTKKQHNAKPKPNATQPRGRAERASVCHTAPRRARFDLTAGNHKHHQVQGGRRLVHGGLHPLELVLHLPGLNLGHLFGPGLFFKALVGHELVHLLPRFQVVELDLLQGRSGVVLDGQDGLFPADPVDGDARVLPDLSVDPPLGIALEKGPELLVLVEGSRGAADDLARDGPDGWEEEADDDDDEEEEEVLCGSHPFASSVLCVRKGGRETRIG